MSTTRFAGTPEDEALLEILHDADERRLADCFRTPQADTLAGKLRKEPRFEARLARLLAERFDLASIAEHHDVSSDDIALARLPRTELEALSVKAGLVVWSASLAREVRKHAVAAMLDRFGEDAFRFALANRDLAGERPGLDDLNAGDALIRSDGRACLVAWIDELPAELARRVRLKWPDDASVSAEANGVSVACGAEIFRRLAPTADRRTA